MTKDRSLLDEPNVIEIAKKHNKTAGQVLLRHALQRGIVVIAKSIKPERIKSNSEVSCDGAISTSNCSFDTSRLALSCHVLDTGF